MSAVLRGMLVSVCLFTLAACQEDGADTVESNSRFPDVIAQEREKCVDDGGRWGATPGDTGFTCFQTLSDANKRCSAESDCQGLCLARSRTCAPVKPFFGCHEVLGSNGLRQTRCIQ